MTFDSYPDLNLPAAELQIRRDPNGGRLQVFDRCRSRWVALTPEEWVRQHFVNMLINHKGYHQGRVTNEIAITFNGMTRRCDTVVFDLDRQPLIIVEYKAPDVPVTQAVFDQIVRYNMVLHARYLAVSNGLTHYCCEIDYEHKSARFIEEIPSFQ